MVHLRSGSDYKAPVVEPQVELEENQAKTHLVTGGGGYPGYRLAKALQEKGHNVVIFDIRAPTEPLAKGIKFVKGDLRNHAEVEDVLEGVDCVYHMASYGMSGREQLNWKLIEEVNVNGTKSIIQACCKRGIERLVYTSTYNVVFGGQVIENGDESLPYLPLDKHPDNYSRTKSIAEKLVLEANGSTVAGGGTLKTCALRLAGVYGPAEERHLPRVMGYVKKGLFAFTYGKGGSVVDFLHVDNLVQAHVLAGEALSNRKQHIAAGQAYFISDGKPINNFEFFRPMIEGLGYKFPSLKVPISLIYFFAFLTEIVHSIVGRVYNFQPMLTRTEVYKTGVTHYFSVGKASRQLGYSPTKQNDLTEVVQHFKKMGLMKLEKKQHFIVRFLVDLTLGLIFASLVLSFLPMVK